MDQLKAYRISVTYEMLVNAECALKKWSMKDNEGLAPQAILAVSTVTEAEEEEDKSFFFQAIELALNDRHYFTEQCIKAYAKAKKRGPVKPEKQE